MVNEITAYVCDKCGTVDVGRYNPKTETIEANKCWQCQRKMTKVTFVRREVSLFQSASMHDMAPDEAKIIIEKHVLINPERQSKDEGAATK